MLLAIDIGNTNIKFALYDGVRQVALWRARSDRKRTATSMRRSWRKA